MAQTDYSELMDIGFAGQPDPHSNLQVKTMRNDEASAAIAFGHAVKYDDPANDKTSAAILTAITGETVPGIVMHSYSYDSTELDATGVLPNSKLNVMHQGRILVPCQDGCDPGDPLFVVAVTATNTAGELRASADGVNTIDMTGRGKWETNAAAGELAWLRVDFLNPLT